MSGHAVRNGIPVCLEPATAECRARWDCSCESWTDLGQNDDLTWAHTAYDLDSDDDVEHVSIGTTSARNCNICNWLNDDLHGTGPGEDWAWGLAAYDIDHPDGEIRVWWEGDYYCWDYVEPKVIGALIGRLVVARWADDLGLDWAA